MENTKKNFVKDSTIGRFGVNMLRTDRQTAKPSGNIQKMCLCM